MSKSTPIEDRIAWSIHHAAADNANAEGACSDCQQRAGFSATSAADGKPTTPVTCHRTHRPDHPWAAQNRAMFSEFRSHGRKGR
jgi:hypothetical protein